MMKFLLPFILLIFAGCQSSKQVPFDYNRSANPWMNAFKDMVFFTAMKETFDKDSTWKMITKKDVLNPYDGLSLDGINLARNLGRKLVQGIPVPPAMCENCAEGQNYYMAIFLHYYNSQELDRIAKNEFKKSKRQDKMYYSLSKE